MHIDPPTLPAPLMEAYKPAPALAPYVTDIWVYEIPAALQTGASANLMLLPDGFPTISFNFGAPQIARYGSQIYLNRSALCGFHARPVVMSCNGHAAGITVRFTPWGMASFLPFSMEEAVEQRVECRDVFTRCEIEDLESELFELPTSVARVRRVEVFLLARLRLHAVDQIVQHMMMCLPAGRSLRELAQEVGLGERTIERRFRRAIGVPPKPFSRVRRLQEALVRREVTGSWIASALDVGYYDQAHLIRDANDIFGLSPEVILASAGNGLAEGFQSLARDNDMGTTIFR